MRVLVVEDEPVIMDTLALQLASGHWHVDGATTAKEGLFKATVNEYSVIVLDLNLPDGDGLTVCHELRQERVTTPVLMLTVRGEISERVLGLETGADDYLIKPYSPLELLSRLRALTRRGSRHRTAVYRAAGLELSTRDRRLVLRGRNLHLPRRQFDLLQFLLEREGEVVSREQLWERVWGWDDYPLHNTIDVHIKRLRDRLGDRDGRLLQTIRGVGYRLDWRQFTFDC